MNIKRIIKIIMIIIVTGLISGIITVMLNHDYFNIKKVIISPTQIIPIEIIEKEMANNLQHNIFKINVNEINTFTIKKIPQFEEIIINKKYPSTLEITIKERTPRINVTTTTTNYIVDENGYILNTPSANSLDNSFLPVFKVRKLKIEQGKIDPLVLAAINNIHISIDKIFRPELLQVDLREANNIEIFADDTLLIKIGNSYKINEKKKALLVLLNQVKNKWEHIEYIDLKSASHPAIKYRKE